MALYMYVVPGTCLHNDTNEKKNSRTDGTVVQPTTRTPQESCHTTTTLVSVHVTIENLSTLTKRYTGRAQQRHTPQPRHLEARPTQVHIPSLCSIFPLTRHLF
eukprot:TRINITY_DN2466_c0_g1_i2.p2 TRINITY_DN2466_c0_g1~~TRINITY_DN2466_c0_g1_i2.p2  ORF type:complete len:103 (+),score=6.77 TRINITY_DN2466_c0_g1_i2:300-608(+)